MAKNLVIVESPAKAKTIEKFLGKDFKVASSYGHIADLPSKELGVDVDGDFSPKYQVSKDKKTIVKSLKDLAKKADMVWLASDEDREGEAIAWHLSESLNLDKTKTKRIVFHEITKSAIEKAVQNPRSIDYDLVDAQQARRVLDRIVGYELSPVLWRKVKGGLSAGRVQSVSVRLIVEREREIKNFTPKATFRVDAVFKTEKGQAFKAKLPKVFDTKEDALIFLEKNTNATYKVSSLDKKPAKKSPAPPFTTSTLQQEASRKLYFSVSKTMNMAQRLYEAGLITYMRTDSVNLSDEARNSASKEINSAFGEDYSSPRNFRGKSKGAQEAHEAIRPTNFALHSVDVDRDQARLYELIWKRAIASQMSDAKLERTNIKISCNQHDDLFSANGEVITFDGFLKVYIEGTDEEGVEQDGRLPSMQLNEDLKNQIITATQRFSRPPYRYTEASLVKKLEELGIGRPSTYAPTISTIQNRNYVEKGTIDGEERKYTVISLKDNQLKESDNFEKFGSDKGKLVPTDIGMIVTDFLVNHFEEILDYNFTAKVEADFDQIANGKADWAKMMKQFYNSFHPQVEEVRQNASRESGERILGTDPKSGRQVSVRLGKFGPMAQIGTPDDEEKQIFASVPPNLQLSSITFEQALDLFKLPKDLGVYDGEDVLVNNGRFGPYVRHGKKFISLPKGVDPLAVKIEDAILIIDEKAKADAPIFEYDGLPVQKGKGRFGPFIKWNNMFINVNKKYDWYNLSFQDVETLIKDKIQKEIDKIVHDWPNEGIRVEKARWGRHNIIKGKIKVELAKNVDAQNLTIEDVKAIIDKQKPKKTPRKSSRKK
ncbi:MAG: type I DNA topoisomerase [Flavobacteriaceae bacterium]